MKQGKIPHKRVKYYGKEFASKAEGLRYLELLQMQKRGEISGLVCQPRFDLIPACSVPRQKPFRAHVYTADFQYVKDGRVIVEDVKSDYTRKSRDYIINRKLMWFLKGIYVHEVIR